MHQEQECWSFTAPEGWSALLLNTSGALHLFFPPSQPFPVPLPTEHHQAMVIISLPSLLVQPTYLAGWPPALPYMCSYRQVHGYG